MTRQGTALAQLRTTPISVHQLGVKSAAASELEWVFNMAPSDMGLRSNFESCLGVTGSAVFNGSPYDFVEAATAHRLILGWLRAMPTSEAGVLQCAYEPRTWPRRLLDELGSLTGIVVRLSCALDPWPEDRRSQELVEMVRAGWLDAECAKRGTEEALADLRRRAETRLARAMKAYASVRGIRPCVVRPVAA